MPSADMSSLQEPRIVTLGDHTSTSLAYGTPVFAQSPCQSGSVRSSRSTSPEGILTSASGDHSSGHGSITSSDGVLIQTGDLNVVTPYTVRNTFIDTTVGRPPSLDGFYDERQVRSCPPTRPSSYDLHDDSLLQMIESLVGKSAGKPPGLESTTSDAPYVVRNTFIDTTVGRSPSLWTDFMKSDRLGLVHRRGLRQLTKSMLYRNSWVNLIGQFITLRPVPCCTKLWNHQRYMT